MKFLGRWFKNFKQWRCNHNYVFKKAPEPYREEWFECTKCEKQVTAYE